MTRLEANRRTHPGDRTVQWVLFGLGIVTVMLVILAVWAAAAIAAAIADQDGPGTNPFAYVLLLVAGAATWPSGAGVVLGVLGFLVAAVSGAGAVLVWRWRARRTWVDARVPALSTVAETAVLHERGARSHAQRLGVDHAGPGSPLGRHARDGASLWAPWEWVQVWIMGPRAGKTSCVCVRQVVETSGPVVATSNKRDLVDLTRGPRSEHGAVWVFDPQDIIGEAPTWWWNPLRGVTGVAEADELAALFVAATRDADAKPDAYFDPEGQALLSGMLLAAACADRPITQVYEWLTHESDPEPATVLAEHGYRVSSDALYAVTQLTPKQRDGVYGTARAMSSFLRNDKVLPWVTPLGPDDDRPQFDPAAFARSRQSIYLISREGRGTARALTAALTVAIVTAAEQLASHSPQGRLATPMTVVLDEAANVCRWPDLPDLYSHYGSKGIVISTFLQAYAQGVQVWGEIGMRKLWSAANIRVIGAGLAEERFLTEVSTLIGDRDVVHRSATTGRGGRGTSASLHREPIFAVSDLAKLPIGRAVMLASGMPATLLRLVHHSQTDYAEKVRASQAYYTSIIPAVVSPTRTSAGTASGEPADRSGRTLAS